ncbi:MAG TPA: hypothetical protein VGB13_07455 [Candidatus Krumholzibacteria bacterium]
MLEAWLAGLEATTLARELRDSVWVYPLVNAAHIAGIALLVGSIIPLDLRLLGVWRSVPLAPLWHVLTRSAGIGLVLAIAFGSLLFITRATEYAVSGFFVSKMAVVGLATANALSLHLLGRARLARAPSATEPPRRVRIAAGVSLVAWLAALTLGRLVGYF